MSKEMVKIMFSLNRDDWHGHTSELLWGEPVLGDDSSEIFRLMSSPFFAKGVSYHDVVRAKLNGDSKQFEFISLVERGGHSNYMVIQNGKIEEFNKYWNILENLGCSYEGGEIDIGSGNVLLYAIDVPPNTDIYKAFDILTRGEAAGAWMFQEGSVGHALAKR